MKIKTNSEQEWKRTTTAFGLLQYIRPFLNEWRGTQLPLQFHIGEASTGKTSSLKHMQNILFGEDNSVSKTMLNGFPSNDRDWIAQLATSYKYRVIDNASRISNAPIMQKISDDLCVIVTDENPIIQANKLYTKTKTENIHIACCVNITALENPFTKKDILERAWILNFGSSISYDIETTYNQNWVKEQMIKPPRYSRERWLAHHFVVLQRLFNLIHKKWKKETMSSNRLINLKQLLSLTSEVFGIDPHFIETFLAEKTKQSKEEADIRYTIIRDYCTAAMEWGLQSRIGGYTADDIINWAAEHNDNYDIKSIKEFRSSNALAYYIRSNETAFMYNYRFGKLTDKNKNPKTKQNKVLYTVYDDALIAYIEKN